jgi:hypothetical protein
MDNETQNVVITNVKMPFFSMVFFMLKWVLAAIPALILIGIISALLFVGFEMLGVSFSKVGEMLKAIVP